MSSRGLVSIALSLIVLSLPTFSQDARPAYRDPALPAEQRAADLLKRMTLEEKVDQLAGGRRRARNSNDAEEKQVFEQLGQTLQRELAGQPARCRRDTQSRPTFSGREDPAWHSRHFPGRSPSRIHGSWQHEFPAGARAGQYTGSRSRARGIQRDLSLIDVNMNSVVEPGMFDLMVGPSSAETSSVALEVASL